MIAIIDADFLLFFCTHQKKDAPLLTPESVKNSADGFLWDIFKRVSATHYLGFLTASPTFRKRLYLEYKQNRAGKELPEYFRFLRNYLKEEWKFIERDLYEADDLALIHKKCYKESVIISPDKDILKLNGLHYNPVQKTFISTLPEDAITFFWRSMLIGDRGDNIKGIDSIGPVKACKYIPDGSSYDYCLNLVLNLYMKTYGEYVGIEQFYLNYKLLKILEEPLAEDKEFKPYEPLELHTNDF